MKIFVALFALLALGHAARVPIQGRIFNGYAASANQFPHQVALVIPRGAGAAICGGSIISSTWVLTAAHCVANANQVNMRFGSINRAVGGVAVTSFRIVRHPAFHPVTLNNDIAVIGLPSALTFNAAVQAIRLPTRSQFGNTFLGATATVSGWGETSPDTGSVTQLRWVNTRVISNAECMRSYGTQSIVGHVVCTIGQANPNQGVCSGDSGGPLIINESGINTQIGVVAFANAAIRGGCATDHPSGYMRTTHFLDWINSHTGVPVRA